MIVKLVAKMLEAEADKLVDLIAPQLIDRFLPHIEKRVTAAVFAALRAGFHPPDEGEP